MVDFRDEHLFSAKRMKLSDVNRRLLIKAGLLFEDSHLELIALTEEQIVLVHNFASQFYEILSLIKYDFAAEVRSSTKLN